MPAPLTQTAENLRLKGQTVVLVLIDGAPAGSLGCFGSDEESTCEAIQALHKEESAWSCSPETSLHCRSRCRPTEDRRSGGGSFSRAGKVKC